jgi:superoxide reductase
MGLFDQINTLGNSNEQATNEKHLPVITIVETKGNKHRIKIDVGGGKHPNEMDHWIQWVELRVDDLYIGRAEFSAQVMDPVVEFLVKCKNPCSISALARCNKHGLWQSTVKCSS